MRSTWAAKKKTGSSPRDWRLLTLTIGCCLLVIPITARLVFLQVIRHGFYEALAVGQHELFQTLAPDRGQIFMFDGKNGQLVPVATNQQLATIYADPRLMKGKNPADIAKQIGGVLGFDEIKIADLAVRFAKDTDPYEPIARDISDDVWKQIAVLKLPGIASFSTPARFYPETEIGGHVLGFIGSDAEGHRSGKYGIEGYFDDILSGTPGFLRSERDVAGRLIPVGNSAVQPAVNGADIVLTIDRNIQYSVCSKLKAAVLQHGADGGSVIVVEPKTGKILAMCGVPDFDPNQFSKVTSPNEFNNPAIFNGYEPGSIFKAITMAAALDARVVEPDTSFEDTGQLVIDTETIHNADFKKYGQSTMTQVLDNSINTGAVFAMQKTGREVFTDYVRKFGFGSLTGIELNKEVVGNITALKQKQEVYYATASFGQAITVTPLQMAMAYAAIANGGTLMKPQIVDEIRYPDGSVDTRRPASVRQVISERSARLLSSMLISVVENGHGKRAGVKGYYIAGKTGTAQVPKKGGGYEDNANIGSFAGFGPSTNPRFAMIVRIDHPRDVRYAESTAAPLFGEITQFLVNYLEIPPER